MESDADVVRKLKRKKNSKRSSNAWLDAVLQYDTEDDVEGLSELEDFIVCKKGRVYEDFM